MKTLNFLMLLILTLMTVNPSYAQFSPVQEQAIEKNYVPNGGFENGIAGWKAYKDAAQATPVDGVSGSPTSSIAVSTSSPMAGKSSLVLTKTAANLQGEGFAVPFVVDKDARGKVMTVSGSYEILSGTYSGGTPGTDSDVEVYVYDVDAGQVIQPAGFKLDGGVTGVTYSISATFQPVNLTSINYRLILHIATTSASAYSLKLDSIKVGVGRKAQGPPVVDWKSYTPTVSAGFGTATSVFAQYARVGDSIYLNVKFVNGTVAASMASVSLPSGLSIDTTKVPSAAFVRGQYATVFAGGAGPVLVDVGVSATNVYFGPTNGNTNNLSANNGNQISANSVAFSFTAGPIPVQGWASTVTMSDSADTRIVAVSVTGDAASATAGNPIIFPTVESDTHAGYNATTGRYTAPVSGWYQLSGYIGSSDVAGTQIDAYVDGAFSRRVGFLDANGESLISCFVKVNAGQIIDIRPTATLNANGNSIFGIVRSSGPSQIAASETVVAIYETSSGQSIANNTEVTVVWNTKVRDTHNAMNTSTGVFTCPISGTYQMSVINTFGTNATGVRYLSLVQSGSASKSYRGPILFATAGGAGGIGGNIDFDCKAGDLLSNTVFQTSGGSLSLSAAGSQNVISIKRVGN